MLFVSVFGTIEVVGFFICGCFFIYCASLWLLVVAFCVKESTPFKSNQAFAQVKRTAPPFFSTSSGGVFVKLTPWGSVAVCIAAWLADGKDCVCALCTNVRGLKDTSNSSLKLNLDVCRSQSEMALFNLQKVECPWPLLQDECSRKVEGPAVVNAQGHRDSESADKCEESVERSGRERSKTICQTLASCYFSQIELSTCEVTRHTSFILQC